jgi:hypothetical protein
MCVLKNHSLFLRRSSLGAARRALHCNRSPSRAGAPARRGVTTHAHAWKCQAHARVAKCVSKGRSHRGVCLICGKRIQMSSGTRTKNQEVRRSSTVLTDEARRTAERGVLSTEYRLGILLGRGWGGGGGGRCEHRCWVGVVCGAAVCMR